MTLHRFKMITKPFWVPLITVIYLLLADTADKLVLAALFFGWTGDLLLMRGRRRWFIAGAASFLIGHLFYAAAFLNSAGGLNTVAGRPLFCIISLLPYIGFLILIKYVLGRNVSSVFLAAAVYLSALMLMSWTALQRLGSVPGPAFLLTFGGSILFIISDSLIGYRNLKRKFKGIGTLIVVTYIAAQLMIIGGLS